MKIHKIDLAKEHGLVDTTLLGRWTDLCSFGWLLLAFPQGLIRCQLGPGGGPKTDFWPLDLFQQEVLEGSILPSGNWTLFRGCSAKRSIYWSSYEEKINQFSVGPSAHLAHDKILGLESTEFGWAFRTQRGLRHSDLGNSWDAFCPLRGSMTFDREPPGHGHGHALFQSSVLPSRTIYLWKSEGRELSLHRANLKSKTEPTFLGSWKLGEEEHLISCHPYLPLALVEGPEQIRVLRGGSDTPWSCWRKTGSVWCWSRYGVRHSVMFSFSFIAEDYAGGIAVMRHDTPATLFATDYLRAPRRETKRHLRPPRK